MSEADAETASHRGDTSKDLVMTSSGAAFPVFDFLARHHVPQPLLVKTETKGQHAVRRVEPGRRDKKEGRKGEEAKSECADRDSNPGHMLGKHVF